MLPEIFFPLSTHWATRSTLSLKHADPPTTSRPLFCSSTTARVATRYQHFCCISILTTILLSPFSPLSCACGTEAIIPDPDLERRLRNILRSPGDGFSVISRHPIPSPTTIICLVLMHYESRPDPRPL
ncbi:hypothetical protein BDZ94DRAFT_918009 [Collybia nuda]|uniref:Uncharacterized protein n=1 Tax=Collybia nuda TaxID=64659 RepID=A0A9P6CPF2_9AGAR|nr:hypothetical protein BDZ94DRAFT_918009 [Collybia nuda]